MKKIELIELCLSYLTEHGHFVNKTSPMNKEIPTILGCTKRGKAIAVDVKANDKAGKVREAKRAFQNHYKKQ